MGKSLTTLFLIFLLFSLSILSSAQTCSNYAFTSNRLFATCTTLPYLNSFLHWTYHQSNSTVDIAYRHSNVDTSTWVAWALNLQGTGMIGAQSLVAYHNSSGVPHAYTSSVSGYGTTLSGSSLSFGVSSISAEYVSNIMVIYATLVLPSGRTSFNQVWQQGPMSSGSPTAHVTSGDNVRSAVTVDFVTGQTSASGGGGGAVRRRRNVHGILNALSWGTLMPLGAMIARYLKVFKSADPTWFYLHVACQSSAYIVGVAGWATGLKFDSDSAGITTHSNISITIFILGTLQVFALFLRSKKDHKFRLYWNIYHWTVGYVTIILSIVNIFQGFDILNPHKNWKRAYIGIIAFLGLNAVMLEAYTWYLVIKRKKTILADKYPNGTNGVNGYGNGVYGYGNGSSIGEGVLI